MVSPLLVVLWFAVCIYQAYRWMFYKPPNFPPGPPRLPILGAYPYLLLLNYKHLHKAIDWLCKYYKSDVIGFYAAGFPVVVAANTELVKQSLNHPEFDGKPPLMLAKLRDPDFAVQGIFFTEGELWHEQRRYALRNLRDFGFGRRHDDLEIESSEEILSLIDLLKNGPKYDFEKKHHDGESAVVPHVFAPTFGNLFMKVAFNDRLPREKLHILQAISESSMKFLMIGDAWGRMFGYNDWIPKLFPNFSEFQLLRDIAMETYGQVKDLIEEQLKTHDPEHERHFVDQYYKKMQENGDNAKNTFYYKQLMLTVQDFIIPALNANALQLSFLLQRFYLQPEILRRCQQEIDTVIGDSRLATLDDRVNLPYIEATIRESMRHETLLPSLIPHTSMADSKFGGYDVPKGSIIASMTYSSHKDDTWDRPEIFLPDRFLDENGKFSPSLDKSFPFGAGKRLCAGETFARNSMFLVAAALIQHFNFELPMNGKMPDPKDAHTGILRSTTDYRLKFVPR